MDEKNNRSETRAASTQPNPGEHGPMYLEPAKGQAEAPERRTHYEYPEDDDERQARLIEEWFSDKFRAASLIDVVGIITGLVLVVVGIIAAFIYDGQLDEMRHTNQLTQKALDGSDKTLTATLLKLQGQIDATNNLYGEAQKQTQQSTKMARAAASQADTAKDALVSVQRAFVVSSTRFVVLAADLSGMNSKGEEVDAMWKNTSETPTRSLLLRSSWMRLESKLPPGFSYPDFGEGPYREFLGREAEIVGGKIVIPMSDEEQIADGKLNYYMWGWATYHDVFPKTKLHITRFCWRITVERTRGEGGAESLKTGSEFCPKNNCADEECEAK